jgi:hypothetical protein
MYKDRIRIAAALLVCAIGPSYVMASNPVQMENLLSGTMGWILAQPATGNQIEGYASLSSVNIGGQIKLFVNTVDPTYQIDVYRMGWYGGAGGRLVLTVGPLTGVQQTVPPPDPTTGMVECNWSQPYLLTVPSTWVSGIFLAKLTGSSGNQSYIIFVVRDDSRSSDFVFQSSTNTFQAYNNWGSKSLYTFNSTSGKATAVSYNRPYAMGLQPAAEAGIGAGDFLTTGAPSSETVPAGWECNMLRWLEQQGFDVTYFTDVDVHEHASLITNHKGLLVIGHSEYWSAGMRTNVSSARDAGVNVGFFGSNICYWPTTYQASAITGAVDRTISAPKTSTWRQSGQPEDALIGVMYTTDPVNGNMTVINTSHWIFAGTGLHDGNTLPGIVGYEGDSIYGDAPPNLTQWAHSNINSTFFDASVYNAIASGAIVFATGSMQWDWGLDDYNSPSVRPSILSVPAQAITKNVLAKFTQPRGAPIRINAGGSDYTDPSGQLWSGDYGYDKGSILTTGNAIGNTSTPLVYQSQRFASSFSYTLKIPNGSYTATLKFAELYYTTAGSRAFNVAINGTSVLTNFDIVAQAGGGLKAIDKTIAVTVSAGQMTIQFTSGSADIPVVNAIDIEIDSGIVVKVSPATVTLGASQAQQFSATVTGTANTAVTWSINPAVGTISSTGLYTAPASSPGQTVTITAKSVADPTKSGTATTTLAATSFLPIRVDSGAVTSYTDPSGNAWSADTGFSGGSTFSVTTAIANTTTPTLYQSLRYGNGFSYQFTVPNGTYSATLKFAETYYTTAGSRVFNVSINGTAVLTNFDIVAQAGGAFKALDKTFSVPVSAGQITIQFATGTADQPVVNAIDIETSSGIAVTVAPPTATLGASQTQQFTATVTGTANGAVTWSINPAVGTISTTGLYTAPASSTGQTVTVTATSVADPTKSGTAAVTLIATVFSPVRVDSGAASSYTDPSGNVWSADTGFTGGSVFSTTHAITNTTTQTLYQSARYGNTFSYQFAVPNATYTVNLKFAETYYTTAGSRVFNVSINGSSVLANFDILSQAGGAFKAIDKSFSVPVSNGQIKIQFTTGTADLPLINAVEIK